MDNKNGEGQEKAEEERPFLTEKMAEVRLELC
jgi:hypothetical protein